MFENQQAFITKHAAVSNSYDSMIHSVLRADQIFRQALIRGRMLCFFHKLLGRSRTMLDLWSTAGCLDIVSRRSDGTKMVQIHQIRGTESRSGDFDCSLYPVRQDTHDRWVNIAAMMLRDESLPPVELIQIGENYFIRDGHHRISVAKMLGQLYIDAEITVWQVEEEQVESPCPGLITAAVRS